MLLERGERLENLTQKSGTPSCIYTLEYIAAQSQQFKGHAVKVRRRLWWQNIRMNIAIALILIVLVAVIIGTPSSSHLSVAAILPKAIKSKDRTPNVGPDPNPGNVNNIEGGQSNKN